MGFVQDYGRDFIKRELVNLTGSALDKGSKYLTSSLRDKLAKW